MATGYAAAALDAYLARLVRARGRVAFVLAEAFAAYAKADPAAGWSDFIAAVYVAVLGTQLESVSAVDDYLASISGATAPLVIGGHVGFTRDGRDVFGLVAVTGDVVKARIAGGESRIDALAASQSYLTGFAVSEPARLGRDLVLDTVEHDRRFEAYQRVAEPGACRFCRMLATRGPVYRSRASAAQTSDGKRYHLHCHCHITAITDRGYADALRKDGGDRWAAMVAAGDSPARLVGTGARATQGREVLAAARARHEALQISQLEASLPGLQRRVWDGDESALAPLQWQTGRLDELRATASQTP